MTHDDYPWLPDAELAAAFARRGIDPADDVIDPPAPMLATCENPACAREFEPPDARQRFCSIPCGRQSDAARKLRTPVTLRPCKQCTKLIPREAWHTPHKYKKIIYCPQCRRTGYGLSERTRSRRVRDASRADVMGKRGAT